MNKDHFLHTIFRSDHFSAEELDTIVPKFAEVRFAKNELILEAGRTENHYWFLQSGLIRSFVIDTDGRDTTTNFYATGDIAIDWTSFFLRHPTRETFQALTDCTCWQLDFETFQQLFHSIRSFREQGRTTLVGSYFALKQQSIAMITDQAKDRYLRLLNEKPHIIREVSLKHIATYLGITDTSLSRIRKEISEA